MSARNVVRAARVGGVALVVASVLFMAVFSYLASAFGYPAVLRAPAPAVLPRLTALGGFGRAVWALYAVIPLLLVPAGIGVNAALGRDRRGAARIAQLFATVAAICMTLGLLRWSTIHWELGGAWVGASEVDRAAIAARFAGLNSFLGTFLGEFVGELCLSVFFATTAWAMLGSEAYPRYVALAGLAAGGLSLVAMFRNVTSAVAPFAAANNVVLPVWLIVLGVFLARAPRASRELPQARSTRGAQ